MNSFNAFVQKNYTGNGSTPVWLGVVSPRPVGGVLVNAFHKAGLFLPAGTPVAYSEANRTITPLVYFKVNQYTSSTADTINVDACVYGNEFLPAVGDAIMVVPSTFSGTGKAIAVTGVAKNFEGGYDVTIAHQGTPPCQAGDYLVIAAEAGSSKAMAVVPNAYLYNDICINPTLNGEELVSVNASGSVVDFHAEGILINRTPAAAFATQMKAAVPGVMQSTF